MKKKVIVILLLIVVICAIIVFSKFVNNSEKNLDKGIDEITFIKLNIGEIEEVTEGQMMHVNDYKLKISDKLLEKGYITNIENNVLTITAKDSSYTCKLIQLSDQYIMPTEQEIDAFKESKEYKKWNKNIDLVEIGGQLEKLKDIECEYFKRLGYTAKNSIDYILTEEEMFQIIDDYLMDKEKENIFKFRYSLFPGKRYFTHYSWGEVSLYLIPKEYEDEKFGKQTSDFSGIIYLIEYYNDEKCSEYVYLINE